MRSRQWWKDKTRRVRDSEAAIWIVLTFIAQLGIDIDKFLPIFDTEWPSNRVLPMWTLFSTGWAR